MIDGSWVQGSWAQGPEINVINQVINVCKQKSKYHYVFSHNYVVIISWPLSDGHHGCIDIGASAYV